MNDTYNPMLFANFFRMWMKKTGRNMSDASRELELSHASILSLSTGKVVPALTSANVKRFATAFVVPAEFVGVLIRGDQRNFESALRDILQTIVELRK